MNKDLIWGSKIQGIDELSDIIVGDIIFEGSDDLIGTKILAELITI